MNVEVIVNGEIKNVVGSVVGNIVVVNLTPHTVNLQTDTGTIFDFVASGLVARAGTKPSESVDLCGLPVGQPTEFTDVVDLPEPQEGVYFIVSMIVGSSVKASGKVRKDLLGPDTTKAIRNEAGQIVAVPRLVFHM